MGSGLIAFDGSRDAVDGAENQPGSLRVRNLQTVVLVERDNELKGVNRIQAQAAGAEEGQVIADFFRRNLKHEVLHHHAFDFRPETRSVVRHHIPPSILSTEPVM